MPDDIDVDSIPPPSLLARIYGVYAIEMEGTAEVHVLLMKNCAKCVNDKYIKYSFDLKGSIEKRFEEFSEYKPKSCLKDENILALKNMREFLTFK